MPAHRSTRSQALHDVVQRLERFDRFVLPTVTLLLLCGAGVIMFGWVFAQQALNQRSGAIEDRIARFSGTVHAGFEGRWQELEAWKDENALLLRRGNAAALQRDLQSRIDNDLTGQLMSWMLIRDDGSVEALAEHERGWAVSTGILDDVRAFGRTVATRQQPRVSDRLPSGDDVIPIAFGIPISAAESGGAPLAFVMVANNRGNPIAAFLSDKFERVDPLGQITLLDSQGQVVMGMPDIPNGIKRRQRIPETDWTAELATRDAARALGSWVYPAVALLLVLTAGSFVFQGILQRRMRRAQDDRNEEVHELYELASRVLHADTIEEQVSDLADTICSLTGADSVVVHVVTVDGIVEHIAGTQAPGQAKVRVPIVGPRSTLGELVLARKFGPLDEDELWVVQTAVTLAGAGIHTLASLETERAASHELQRLDELRSNLLTTVSHELLSPLTAVKGVLGLLAMQDDLGERGQEYVEVATDRTDRLVALIRDLFDCSLLETGQLDIRPTRQRADELLEAALGAQAAARPGELRLSATANLMVTADPVRFDQLVTNLVTNAFRHGAPPVEVAVRPADGGVLVVVTDEGKGIAPDARDDVFGKFWQVSSGHARVAEGAGLGLNLVRGLVELHGGHITIDSTHADGRGARFTVYLPDVVPTGAGGGEQGGNAVLAAPTVGTER